MTTAENGLSQGQSSIESRPTIASRVLLGVAIAAPALLYLVYVSHFALNVPFADDWGVMSIVSRALHHHLTMSALWSQYGDTRLLIARLFFVGFGFFDHLNERSIILFSAGIFIVSFGVLLLLFRSYLGRQLTFLPVLSLGVVWFSLADVQNSLWGFQLAWYVVVFCFVAMAYLLLVPQRRRNLCVALAVVAAVVASLSEVQGFVVWPAGLICLLWTSPWVRRTYNESAIWTSAAVLTTVVYLVGFSVGAGTYECLVEGGQKSTCSLSFGISHPFQLTRFFVVLVGNVVPTAQGRYLVVHELVGTAVLIAAGFVVVQSIRARRRPVASPLPLVMIVFALLFDLMLALSRLGDGIQAAGLNRYTMPNVILLVGVVVYAWGHVPSWKAVRAMTGRERLTQLALGLLAAFVVAQCAVATHFGITDGATVRDANAATARVAVNLDRIPTSEQACYATMVVGLSLYTLEVSRSQAARTHLSVFQPESKQKYRAEGPPHVAQCERK